MKYGPENIKSGAENIKEIHTAKNVKYAAGNKS